MDISFTQDDVVVAPNFNLVAILRTKEHLIAWLH